VISIVGSYAIANSSSFGALNDRVSSWKVTN
jgi:hypothetical protein